jgi:hypothetical protein
MRKLIFAVIFFLSISGIFSNDISGLNKLLSNQANEYLSIESEDTSNYRNSVNQKNSDRNGIQIHHLNREAFEHVFKKRGHIWKRMVQKTVE